jgi:hypothetical protein
MGTSIARGIKLPFLLVLALALNGCSITRNVSREPMFAALIDKPVALTQTMYFTTTRFGHAMRTDDPLRLGDGVRGGVPFVIRKVVVRRFLLFPTVSVFVYGEVPGVKSEQVYYVWPRPPRGVVPQGQDDDVDGSWIGRAFWEGESVPLARRVYPKSKFGQRLDRD